MKINLLHRYQSAATNEEALQAGEHDLDDTIAQYLIDNGHAVIVEAPQDEIIVSKPKRRRRKTS